MAAPQEAVVVMVVMVVVIVVVVVVMVGAVRGGFSLVQDHLSRARGLCATVEAALRQRRYAANVHA